MLHCWVGILKEVISLIFKGQVVHEAGICIPVPSYTSLAIISIEPLTGQILPVYPYHILAFFTNHSTLEDEPIDVASRPEDWNPAVLHVISIGPSVF
jgi:hypothetical protein